ncbi:MAG: hypothetical protein A3E01_04485 [Gammaproteobacteria bacterium RIFCSPHIGHO2_12_FULL_63_22]|nr:MAG: hypothetical protein A3E01_04485 [Gammaproteobacteria bacterium RIFCSPHIGHO2_12_FULL_63_22]
MDRLLRFVAGFAVRVLTGLLVVLALVALAVIGLALMAAKQGYPVAYAAVVIVLALAVLGEIVMGTLRTHE